MPLDQPNEHDPSDDPDEYRGELDDQGHYPLSNDHTMPLGDHLEELRGRVVRMLIGVVLALVITIIFGFDLIAWFAQPLLHVQNLLGVPAQPIQTDPTFGFTSVYLPVVFVAAVILAAPWIIWQAWQFIVVGLYDHEKKAVHILAPFSTVMTALGVLFTYYILLPVSMAFFLNFINFYPDFDVTSEPNALTKLMLSPYASEAGTSLPDDFEWDTEPSKIAFLETAPENPAEGDLWINGSRGRVEMFFDGQTRIIAQRSTKLITPLPTLGEYIRFATFMTLGIVVAFQLPVIMLVLGWIRLFDPTGIAQLRKYALFIAFVAGAILTPADPFSMLVLAIPLYLLFEFGLALMKLTYRRKAPEMPADL
eukprot:g12021.t1